MLVWRRSVWFAGLLGSLALLQDVASADDRARDRLVAEAELLFVSVLAEDPPAERCELSADWDDYPIPEDIARKHLGIRLHASLSAPYSGTNAFQVLKPRTEEMLCHAAEAKDMESQRLAAFEAGTDKAAFIRQRKYSFPVFSENYRTAIFVVTHMRLGWYRSARGVARLPLEADWSAVVYRKVGGQWRNVDRIGLAAT